MSTRYVWGKYNKNYSISKSETKTGSISGTNTSSEAPILASGYTIDSEGYFEPVGGNQITFAVGTSQNARDISTSSFPYLFNPRSYISGKGYSMMYMAPDGVDTWHATYIYSGSGFGTVNVFCYMSTQGYNSSYYAEAIKTPIQGTFIADVSSSASSTYPNNGEKSGYWYTYKGSDSIDPVSISYSEHIEYQGEGDLTRLHYTITPSNSNTFGGTIEYSIEYNENSTGWNGTTSWSSSTTGSRIGFKKGATYQFRVRARDNLGFTSTTYVTGPVCTVTNKPAISLSVSPLGSGTVSGAGEYSSGTSVTVKASSANGWEFVGWDENGTIVSVNASYTFTISTSRNLTAVFKQKLTAWVGVNGKDRKGVEMWVGVNGKARKVTAAWIGVNGKARRFL